MDVSRGMENTMETTVLLRVQGLGCATFNNLTAPHPGKALGLREDDRSMALSEALALLKVCHLVL